MANIVRLKRRASGGSAGAPSSLKTTEVAYNEVDDIIYIGYGDDGSGNATSIRAVAGAGAFLGLTGNQTVAGVKTFSSFPVTPSSAPTTDYQVANKKFVLDSMAGAGAGDMVKATYDPTNKNSDAFSQDNMVDGTTNKNFTATEKTKLAGVATGAIAASTTATLTNKTFDANGTGNSISNIDLADLTSGIIDTDVTLAANSDSKIATQKAVKAYADARIAAADAMVFKGVIDCSANPNYPAADRGDTYRVSVAGKIGGASGLVVEAGDILLCLTDSTASGNQATVGSAWSVIQTNIDGAVTLTGTQTLTNKTITSPTLDGTPVAPTASAGTNTTQIATTANVVATIAAATIDGGTF